MNSAQTANGMSDPTWSSASRATQVQDEDEVTRNARPALLDVDDGGSSARLTRQPTNHSVHAQNSLRRMATHETGHGIDHDRDGNDKLEAHDEGHEEEQSASGSRRGSGVDETGDEEDRTESDGTPGGGKKEAPKLQDQTNLLPVKQVILVFVGLTCALFCSLIDQTM